MLIYQSDFVGKSLDFVSVETQFVPTPSNKARGCS